MTVDLFAPPPGYLISKNLRLVRVREAYFLEHLLTAASGHSMANETRAHVFIFYDFK